MGSKPDTTVRTDTQDSHLERLFALSLDMLCVAGLDGFFKRINPAFERVLGYPAEELLAKPFIHFVHPDDRPATVREMEKLASGVPTIRFENRFRASDGSWRWLSWTCRPDPETGLLFAASRDITARKEIDMLNRDLLRDLERANAELGDFAYVVSHDLKAPLRAIGSLAAWVVEDYAHALDAKGCEMLATLQERVRRMAGMIDGILQYSRVGRAGCELEEVDSQALAREVLDSLEVPQGIEVEIHETLPVVRYRRVHLGQVLQNLIGNAIKHMGRPAGHVEVQCRASGGAWVFAVRDDGPGIEERHFDRIFKLFQSLEAAPQDASSGIGLALVKKIVEGFGGRVWVESALGQGSAFFFTVPQRTEESFSRPAPEVLVVSSDPGSSAAGARMLAELGCHVRVAGSASDATATLLGSSPPCELALVCEGDLGGPTTVVVEALVDADPGLRVMVCGEDQGPEIRNSLKQAGAAGFITKTSDPERMRQSILEALGPAAARLPR